MWVLGVTGGIGSGKTTVTDCFARLGITIVDADVIARHIMDPGSPALAAVITRYGQQVLLDNGQLNRAWLRERIFQDTAEKQWLNALTHPLIRTQINAQLQQASSAYVILSAPLLIENKLTKLCDRVLVVDVPEALQISRTQARDDVTAAQVRSIMQSQCSRKERLAQADDVIVNDGSLADLEHQVVTLHQGYLMYARQADQMRKP